MTNEEQILDSWQIHSRIVLFVLEAIEPGALESKASTKGRTVGAIFAHMHNNRVAWVESAAPPLMAGLAKIEKELTGNKELLQQALESSGQAVSEILKSGLESGKVKNFKPHPVAFMGYLISHDAYHLGEIGLALSLSGHKLEDKIGYGMWDWNKR